MLIQRMKAWKSQDFTKELTGANPMQHIANQVTHYYQQVWQNVLMIITDAVLSTTDLKKHIYDITKVGDGKVTTESLIYAQEAAFGDHAMSGACSSCIPLSLQSIRQQISSSLKSTPLRALCLRLLRWHASAGWS